MLQFDNTYHRQLPGFYTELMPTPLNGARLLYHSEPLAQMLGLDSTWFEGDKSRVWNGETILPGMAPLAQVYSGHQFGIWAGQLGDGRGILLGEQTLSDGRKYDWHLKGAGKTPYSRMGDGHSVLRSSIREFLASEALHALKIPTTRALTITTSDQPVFREQPERGSMLLRVAESHIRFGHFEHFYYRQQQSQVKMLADYVIEHHWPELQNESDRYQQWFTDVVKRTARLMADWQAVGFSHGVMNTDNMSILGLTIDFGPYGFLDDYKPDFICNHSDHQGRYAFDNQPSAAYWNLHRLAQALSTLLSPEQLQRCLDAYEPELMAAYGQNMRNKLGLARTEENDNSLLVELFTLMEQESRDYTRTFRLLSEVELNSPICQLRDEFIDRSRFDTWLKHYQQRLKREELSEEARRMNMLAHNPKRILRNYLAQEAIEKAEKDDVSGLARLHQALLNPFDEAPEFDDLAQLPPEWGKKLEISCSS